MAFENKTVADIYSLIVQGLETEFNTTFRLLPKAFVRVLAKVLAGVYVSMYKVVGWSFLQQFVDYAVFEPVTVLGVTVRPLVEWGNLVGVGDPGDATAWEGTISVGVVAAGDYLQAGTQLKSALTGKIYLTKASVLLTGVSVSVDVICTEGGTAGNLAVGDTLSFVNNLGAVERDASVVSGVNGVDAETEDTYRNRVKARFKVQPQGGALADYRRWASEVPGVYQTYPYSDDQSSTGVIIYVAGDPAVYPNRLVPSSVLKAVGEACTYDPETGEQNRKPVGAVLDPDHDETYSNVKTVSVTKFDVEITGLSGIAAADFAGQAKSDIALYFDGREPWIRGLAVDNNKVDTISKNNIIGIVNELAIAVKASFSDITITKGGVTVTSYTLDWGELAALDHFYIDGVEY